MLTTNTNGINRLSYWTFTSEIHHWGFCTGSAPAIGTHHGRVVIGIEVAGVSCETQPRRGFPPLTLCPVCDLPKSTSEASSPSKFRFGGGLAPARAIAVGKMSSMLQKEQDTVCLYSPKALPGPPMIHTPQNQPQAGAGRLSCSPQSLFLFSILTEIFCYKRQDVARCSTGSNSIIPHT